MCGPIHALFSFGLYPPSFFSPNIMQEIQKKNEALLQMYGEKAELAEELKLDIQDLKEMYRQQIDTLTKR